MALILDYKKYSKINDNSIKINALMIQINNGPVNKKNYCND